MGLIKNDNPIIVKRVKNSDGSYSYTCDKSFDYVRNVALNRNIKVLLITGDNRTKILTFSTVDIDLVRATGIYVFIENNIAYAKIEDVRFKDDGSITRELREVKLS